MKNMRTRSDSSLIVSVFSGDTIKNRDAKRRPTLTIQYLPDARSANDLPSFNRGNAKENVVLLTQASRKSLSSLPTACHADIILSLRMRSRGIILQQCRLHREHELGRSACFCTFARNHPRRYHCAESLLQHQCWR